MRLLPVITDQVTEAASPARQAAHAELQRACTSLCSSLRLVLDSDRDENRRQTVRLVGELRRLLHAQSLQLD